MKIEAAADRREMRDTVNILSATVSNLTNSVNTFADQVEDDRKAIVESFDKMHADISRLVDIVENTRDFSTQVARLAIASEKRLASIEARVDKIDGQQP